MEKMKKREEAENGRVIVFRGFETESNKDSVLKLTEDDLQPGEQHVVDVLPVKELHKDRVVTDRYVLPLSDAKVMSSEQGLVYVFNASLPYLAEVAHLAEVEKNIVIGQAYLYQGRNINTGKPSLFQWMLVIFIFILAALAIFKH